MLAWWRKSGHLVSFPAVSLWDIWRGSVGFGGIWQKVADPSLSSSSIFSRSERFCSWDWGRIEGWRGDLIWGSLSCGFIEMGSLGEESFWGDALEHCCSDSVSICWQSTQSTSLPDSTEDSSNERVSLPLNHTTTVTHPQKQHTWAGQRHTPSNQSHVMKGKGNGKESVI